MMKGNFNDNLNKQMSTNKQGPNPEMVLIYKWPSKYVNRLDVTEVVGWSLF